MQPGRDLLRHLVDGAGGVDVLRAERLQERPGRRRSPRGCARTGCRGRPRPRSGRAARAAARARPRPPATPRPRSPRCSSPSRRTSGWRRRSGSSWSAFRPWAFGQRKPRLKTSSSSPRIEIDRRRCPSRSAGRTWPRTAGRCGCAWPSRASDSTPVGDRASARVRTEAPRRRRSRPRPARPGRPSRGSAGTRRTRPPIRPSTRRPPSCGRCARAAWFRVAAAR